MQSPYIGRGIALVVIVGLVAWTAFRALGARPAETPKIPFWRLPRASKPPFLLEAVFGASRPSSSISREFLP